MQPDSVDTFGRWTWKKAHATKRATSDVEETDHEQWNRCSPTYTSEEARNGRRMRDEWLPIRQEQGAESPCTPTRDGRNKRRCRSGRACPLRAHDEG